MLKLRSSKVIPPSFFLLIFTFYTKNSDILKPRDARRVREHAPRKFFLCDRNLVNFGDVLLRFYLTNDKNNDKL